MKKTQLILILFLIATTFKSQKIDCKTNSQDLLRPSPPIRLRSFNIFPAGMLHAFRQAQELHEKIQKDKETKRMRMFEDFFAKHPLYRKSYLNDFHTSRFF